MPKAPGTFGTLAAIPVYLLLVQSSLWVFLLMTFIITIAVFISADYTSRALGVHDHSGIVIDEIAGYLITMIAVPLDMALVSGGFYTVSEFLIFLKPWPISWLDKKVQGGFGIMIDDVVAGVFACISLHAIIYFFGDSLTGILV